MDNKPGNKPHILAIDEGVVEEKWNFVIYGAKR